MLEIYTLGVNGSMTVSKTVGGGSNPSGYARHFKHSRGVEKR